MTLFHGGSCLTLAYFLYLITYKRSSLYEYTTFWKCAQAGVTRLFTQPCKMLFLAIFFVPTQEGGTYDFTGEVMKPEWM